MITCRDLTIADLNDRIARLEAQLAGLRQERRAVLVRAIATSIGPGIVFTSRELFQHRAVNPALAAALRDAGIVSARQLGKRLQQLRGSGLDRVGADHDGAVWVVSA